MAASLLLLLLAGGTAQLIDKIEPIPQDVKLSVLKFSQQSDGNFIFPEGSPQFNALHETYLEISFNLTGLEKKSDFPSSIRLFKNKPGVLSKDKVLGFLMSTPSKLPFRLETKLSLCKNHSNLFIEVQDPYRGQTFSETFSYVAKELCVEATTESDQPIETAQEEAGEGTLNNLSDVSPWMIAIFIEVAVLLAIFVAIIIIACRKRNLEKETKEKGDKENIEVWRAESVRHDMKNIKKRPNLTGPQILTKPHSDEKISKDLNDSFSDNDDEP